MATRNVRFVSLLLAGALALLPGVASALAQASGARHAEARLLAGGEADGALLAGVEITLDPGFKTYWRTPGESGLPPSFDWSRSHNVDRVEIAWPAPERVEDAGGVAYAYEDRVVLPLRVHPADPARPVTLTLRLDYGVCRDLCIPEHADLTRALPRARATTEREFIESAARTVPKPKPLGAAGAPAIVAVERITGSDKLKVTARVEPGAQARLFVEAPDPWFLLAEAKPDAAPGASDGIAVFTVGVLQRPNAVTGPIDVTLTLVAGGAVETRTRLDEALLTR